MSDRFFLDTNIFVYVVAVDDPKKSKLAVALIQKALSTRNGIVSFQVAQEFFNVALRRFDRKMNLAEREDYLQVFFGPLLKVHSSLALYSEALALQSRHQLSWYDSLIVCAALQAGCTILYSEDFQPGQRFGKLRVVNPFA